MRGTSLLSTLTVLIILAPGGVARAASLEVGATQDPLVAPRGATVVVHGQIQNDSPGVVYLNSVGADILPAFAGPDLFDDYATAAPDSLLPGEGWEGPMLRLTLAPDAPVSRSLRFTMMLYGGDHPLDTQWLGELDVTVDDSLAIGNAGAEPVREPGGAVRATPNPSRGASTIHFYVDHPGRVTVDVFDVRGRRVRALIDESLPAGPREITWDGQFDDREAAPPGFYFVRVRSDGDLRRTKVLVLP